MKKYTKVLAIFLSLLLAFGSIPAFAAEYLKIPISSDGDFTPGSTDVTFTVNRGHAGLYEFGGDYGTVINMGMASTDGNPKADTSQTNFVTGNGYTHLNFEFDLCVQEAPTAKGLTLTIRNTLNGSTSLPDIFKVNGSKFEAGGNTFSYTLGKWYTISVEVNMTSSGYYTVNIIDGNTVTTLANQTSQAFGTFSMWRIYGSTSMSDYAEFYLDNFKFYNMVEKPADYVAPNVSISADKDEYYYGETANLTISPQGNYLKSTTVYVNDVKEGAYTDAVINIPYTPAVSGTYKVKAVTENNYGITAEKEYTLTVNANENPTVSFQGIDSAVTFEEDDDMTLTVNASDDIEVLKTELYVGGELKETVSATTLSYDLKPLGLSYGTYEVEAKVYDKYSLTASKKISVTLQPENYTSPTVLISADSYSAVCGGTVSLSVEADGSHFEGVDVYVDDALYQSYTDKAFTVNISKILDGNYKVKTVAKDTIGKEATDEKTVTFNLPDGYITPTASITTESTHKKLGESLTATVLVSGSHWTDVDVYINGELYKNYEQASFNISYTPDSAGTYKIKAVAKDEFNKTDEKEITFVVNANAAPTVSFSGIENGGIVNYEYDAAKLLNVTTADSDGIEKLEIYVDDVLKATGSSETMQLDFDALGLGLGSFNLRAVAYDSYGLSREAEITLTVTSSIKTLKEQNSNFTSDITLAEVRGHARVGTVDVAHGNSVILGMAEGEDNATVNYSRADISLGGYSHVEFKFDVCVQEKPSAKGMTLTMRTTDENGSAKGFPELFVVNANNFTSGGGSFAYDTGVWYTICVEADTAADWYSTKVINEGEETVLSSFAPFDFGTFSLWRFHTGTNASDYYEVAVDNFKFSEIITAPSIVSVGYDDENSATEIPSSAQKINVVLDGALTAEDINSSNVKLMKGAQEIKIKRVQYDVNTNTVSLIPDTALESATDYSIVFDENIRISGTTVLGDKIIASFKTAPSGAEIEEIVWKSKKDNSADLSFAAKNLAHDEESGEYDDVPVCCIVTLWDAGGRFVKAYADSFTLGEAEKIHSMNIEKGALYNAEIYFASSFDVPQIYEVANFAK